MAARAEGVSRIEALVLQPGESLVLQVTWRPCAAGAVRGVLHLAHGDQPTRLQARPAPIQDLPETYGRVANCN